MKNNSAEHILACRDLCVGYKDKTILSNLNLDFEPGRFISLLGPNGAGKTTFLRTLSRHLPPLSGDVFIEGTPLMDIRQADLAKTMAVVLTDKVAPPLFTVFEFTALGRYPHTNFLGRLNAGDYQAVRRALAAVHAEDLADRQFANLSDGERQKALVARALAQEPRLLLLDEPTLHLDLKHRIEVMSILRSQCRERGITVVASLHDVDIAAKLSDRTALIKNGGIVDYGSPETVLKTRSVADLYDFSEAIFDQNLGGIELRGEGRGKRIFVAAGLGSGALIYRLLAKRGFDITTGIVPTNDLDCYVAHSLGAECIVQDPLQKTNGAATRDAIERLERCDAVIDAGFAVGEMNRANLDIIQAGIERGKKVFSLRKDGAARFSTAKTENLVVCTDPVEMLDGLENYLDRRTVEFQEGER